MGAIAVRLLLSRLGGGEDIAALQIPDTGRAHGPGVDRAGDMIGADVMARVRSAVVKLLAAEGEMHTATGRRLAGERTRYMREFLERVEREWRGEA